MRALAIGLSALVLVAGYWWWQGRARPVLTMPEVAATSGASAVSPVSLPPLAVHVLGKVREPGVVDLPAGSRVLDAVDAAGGLRPGASYGDLNLARPLTDGEQIVVGRRGAAPVEVDPPAPSQPSGAGSLVNINTASASELEALPGVGPVLAQRIVQWRSDNGAFTAVDILGEVSGIGDVLLEQLRPLIAI